MKLIKKHWMLPLAGSFFAVAAAASAADRSQLERINVDSTNRLTASFRYGMNISGKFKNPGGSLNPNSAPANGRRTPHGDKYNYDDGYVLTDSSGNYGRQTWYWGYDGAGQLNASAGTIDFNNYTAPGLPGSDSGDDSPNAGIEIAYNHELGVKEIGQGKHIWRYGIESAVNFMPIHFSSGGTYKSSINRETDSYGYTENTTPPSAPYQGSFGGNGFLLGSTPMHQPSTSIPGATVITHQDFDANLWGFRLGPYLETPLSEKFTLHFSGGLAAGILDASVDWKETVTLPMAGGSTSTKGGGHDTSVLWGYFLGASAIYRINPRWGIDFGVQYQNLGTYDHNFGGRVAELDLSKSVFVQAGISYSF